MDRKRTRSSERKLKQGKKQCNKSNEADSNPYISDSNPYVEFHDKDLKKRPDRTHVSWHEQHVLRSTAIAEIGGFPIPEHNFPTALMPQERDHNLHPIVQEVNLAIRKLNMYRNHMFDDCGKHLSLIHI